MNSGGQKTLIPNTVTVGSYTHSHVKSVLNLGNNFIN